MYTYDLRKRLLSRLTVVMLTNILLAACTTSSFPSDYPNNQQGATTVHAQGEVIHLGTKKITIGEAERLITFPILWPQYVPETYPFENISGVAYNGEEQIADMRLSCSMVQSLVK